MVFGNFLVVERLKDNKGHALESALVLAHFSWFGLFAIDCGDEGCFLLGWEAAVSSLWLLSGLSA
jgi:hypothetical protein